MLGKKERMRRIAFPALCGFFLLIALGGVYADDNFRHQIIVLFSLEEGQVGTQGAELVGAFNTDGWVQGSEGIVSVDDESQTTSLFVPTPEGGLCIGECQDREAEPTSSSTEVVSESIAQDESSQSSSSSDQHMSTSSEEAEASSSTEDVGEVNPEETEDEEDTEEDKKSETEGVTDRSYRQGSRGSKRSPESEDNSNTSSSTIDVEEDTGSTLEPDGSSEGFLAALESVMHVEEGRIALGMAPLSDFAFSVFGWLFASQGVIVGSNDTRVGLGMTSEGICLGSCDFDFQQADLGVDTLSSSNESDLGTKEATTSASSTVTAEDSKTQASSSSSTSSSSSLPVASSTSETTEMRDTDSASSSEATSSGLVTASTTQESTLASSSTSSSQVSSNQEYE